MSKMNVKKQDRKAVVENHVPGRLVHRDGRLVWELDSANMSFSERTHIAITARRTLADVFPNRDVGRIRDGADKVTVTVEK